MVPYWLLLLLPGDEYVVSTSVFGPPVGPAFVARGCSYLPGAKIGEATLPGPAVGCSYLPRVTAAKGGVA